MEPALAIFAPLIGHCFAATIAPDTIDRHCFASVYEGAHVRDTHVVEAKGKVVLSGEILISFDGDGLEMSYFNSFGGVGYGTGSIEGSRFSFTGSMRKAPRLAPRPMDGRWRISDIGIDAETDGQPTRRFRRAD